MSANNNDFSFNNPMFGDRSSASKDHAAYDIDEFDMPDDIALRQPNKSKSSSSKSGISATSNFPFGVPATQASKGPAWHETEDASETTYTFGGSSNNKRNSRRGNL